MLAADSKFKKGHVSVHRAAFLGQTNQLRDRMAPDPTVVPRSRPPTHEVLNPPIEVRVARARLKREGAHVIEVPNIQISGKGVAETTAAG
jgi:hypothetical protein